MLQTINLPQGLKKQSDNGWEGLTIKLLFKPLFVIKVVYKIAEKGDHYNFVRYRIIVIPSELSSFRIHSPQFPPIPDRRKNWPTERAIFVS